MSVADDGTSNPLGIECACRWKIGLSLRQFTKGREHTGQTSPLVFLLVGPGPVVRDVAQRDRSGASDKHGVEQSVDGNFPVGIEAMLKQRSYNQCRPTGGDRRENVSNAGLRRSRMLGGGLNEIGADQRKQVDITAGQVKNDLAGLEVGKLDGFDGLLKDILQINDTMRVTFRFVNPAPAAIDTHRRADRICILIPTEMALGAPVLCCS